MQRGTVNCTAITFVKNGGPDFKHCLDSCLFCNEHIVLDGGSTDATTVLAEQYGCTVLQQSSECLDENGKIIDFSGITNQGITAAQNAWLMILSADECINEKLRDAITQATNSTVPGVYNFNRKYSLHGKPISYAANYPNRQLRFMHKEAIYGFVKKIHERPHVKEGIIPKVLNGDQLVPLDSYIDLARKHDKYIAIAIDAMPPASFFATMQWSLKNVKVLIYYSYKLLLVRATKPWSQCLPLKYEWLNFRYAILFTWRRFLHRN